MLAWHRTQFLRDRRLQSLCRASPQNCPSVLLGPPLSHAAPSPSSPLTALSLVSAFQSLLLFRGLTYLPLRFHRHAEPQGTRPRPSDLFAERSTAPGLPVGRGMVSVPSAHGRGPLPCDHTPVSARLSTGAPGRFHSLAAAPPAAVTTGRVCLSDQSFERLWIKTPSSGMAVPSHF